MLRRHLKNQQVTTVAVIPAKAGIQYFQYVPDISFRRYDELA